MEDIDLLELVCFTAFLALQIYLLIQAFYCSVSTTLRYLTLFVSTLEDSETVSNCCRTTHQTTRHLLTIEQRKESYTLLRTSVTVLLTWKSFKSNSPAIFESSSA